jgi:hypothetical protein
MGNKQEAARRYEQALAIDPEGYKNLRPHIDELKRQDTTD